MVDAGRRARPYSGREENGDSGLDPGLLDTVRRRLMAAYPDILLRARSDDAGRESVRRAIRQILVSDGLIAERSRRDQLVPLLFEEIAGYGPIEPLLSDPGVQEIMVNGPGRVYVERSGCLYRAPVSFRDDAHVLDIIARMLAVTGRRVDLSQPYIDARLPDGSRMNAVIPPVALDGPTLTVRRFGSGGIGPSDLLRFLAVDEHQLGTLRSAVEGRLNIVVSGGASSGKTTFLNALATYIDLERERVITIEDAAELRLGGGRQKGNLVRLECRPPNVEGKGHIDQRQLVKNSLRMRPDRVIVGECRGAEAFDMLQAMNTGHPGSMTTVHANSPADALRRLEIMVLMAGEGLPYEAVRDHIGSAVDVVVHLARRPGGVRRVSDIAVVRGYDRASGTYDLAAAGRGRDGIFDFPLSDEQRERVTVFAGGAKPGAEEGR